MIRVRAASRLHFGLLGFGPQEPASSREGETPLPARRFGGAGLMVRQPGLTLAVRPAATWSAEGPLAERALAFARQLVQTFAPARLEPQHLHVEQAAPEHAGLGTGTGLGLAVARALAVAAGLTGLTVEDLAYRVGRGKRSGLGIHGFARGGFLVDGGKDGLDAAAPLVARVDFPESWRVVLILPARSQGLHGESEIRAFERLREAGAASAKTDRLCRLVLLGMLPALVERDLDAFGEAVHDFNRRVGEWFAPVQGGCYAHPRTAAVVAFIRQWGVRGVGQSSWGPAVFAIAKDEDQAGALVGELRQRFGFQEPEVISCSACNRGAAIEEIES